MFMPQPPSVMNTKKHHSSSRIHEPPLVNSLKLIIKFKNSRPYAILPISKCNESIKRKEPEKEINLDVNLYDQTWLNIMKHIQNKKTKILDPSAAAYMGGSKQSSEDIRVAKQLKSFSVYSHQEEQEENFMGVSTKLTLLAPAH